MSLVIAGFRLYPSGFEITNSTSIFCIACAKLLATACGKAFTCGAQLRTTLGFFFVAFSEMVIASVKPCKGCPVALSILTIGTEANFINDFKTCSDSSFSLSVSVGKALTAIISQYCETTAAASFICSAVVPFIMVPSSNSIPQASPETFITIGSIPKFKAAFWVLKRVLRLELKNKSPNVLFFPNSLFFKGFTFKSFASAIQELIFSMSFMEV